ncbi:MAG: hypothetical protein DWQ06_13860 [Calditrichaeota bacterium]|nr:MAG: hypothetical protein DWQ06_13860 [Calditrichota bacterium]
MSKSIEISFKNIGDFCVELFLKFPTKTVRIDCSNAFPPFYSFFNFVELIAENSLPTEITIDEEGYGKTLTAFESPQKNEDFFLLEIETWATKDDKVLIEIELSKEEFILQFVTKFEKFLKQNPKLDSEFGGEDENEKPLSLLKELPFAKIKNYFKKKKKNENFPIILEGLKMDNIFLKSFHIAGFSYYQGAFVFGDLKIGSEIELVLDEKNIYDDHAVELRFQDKKIGYIPKGENREIALILKAGYKIFEAVVQQISPDEHPENQVRIGVFVDKREDFSTLMEE